jgi:hypothetical protein
MKVLSAGGADLVKHEPKPKVKQEVVKVKQDNGKAAPKQPKQVNAAEQVCAPNAGTLAEEKLFSEMMLA